MTREAAFIDYYAALGIATHATNADIRRAYVCLAKEMHPDAGGDHEAMEALNKAYTTLKNERSRRAYDLLHQVHTGTSSLHYRMTGETEGEFGSLAGMSDEEIDAFVNEAFVAVASDKTQGSLKKKAKQAFRRRKKQS